VPDRAKICNSNWYLQYNNFPYKYSNVFFIFVKGKKWFKAVIAFSGLEYGRRLRIMVVNLKQPVQVIGRGGVLLTFVKPFRCIVLDDFYDFAVGFLQRATLNQCFQ